MTWNLMRGKAYGSTSRKDLFSEDLIEIVAKIDYQ